MFKQPRENCQVKSSQVKDGRRKVRVRVYAHMTTYAYISGLVVECRIRNFQVAGSNLTAGHLQATLSKLLTYGVHRSTLPPTLHRTGNE